MISHFKRPGETAALFTSTTLAAFLPVGFTIGSGLRLTDPNDPRNFLRISSGHYSLSKDTATYVVEPLVG